MNQILIVLADQGLRSRLESRLARDGHDVHTAGSAAEVLGRFDPAGFDLVLAAEALPDGGAVDLLGKVHPTPLVVLASDPTVQAAVAAMRAGAADYVDRPDRPDEVAAAVARQVEDRHPVDLDRRGVPEDPDRALIGSSPQINAVREQIGKVAATPATVLVLGESGTGKELVANAIHTGSPRRDRQIVAVNCAAIPESLIESELFGHEKGSFTGAVSARRGLLHSADGGTLFLDEIAELSMSAQARLLRVLEDGEVRSVGSDQMNRVDIRLIAATHRDLAERVRGGRFREDLYYRLKVMEIWLPPLRERGNDVVELAEYFLARLAARHGRRAAGLTRSARQRLLDHGWPGNVRELENALERALVLSGTGARIGADQILPEQAPVAPQSGWPEDASLDEYFVQFVLAHEDRCTETEIARRLGISRKSLWERRNRLGIPRTGARTG